MISTRMNILRKIPAGIAYPFGDERSVNQAFPSAIHETEADPFLMCDYFTVTEQDGPEDHPDSFPVDWHPHKGFDIATYLKSGRGRHADSLGNRETFATPGMQWMSVGSGVEHAEGGATEKGTEMQGFQIWINVPSARKMDPPRYGTVTPPELPKLSFGNGDVHARVLAGTAFGQQGPFETVQNVQMIDFELEESATLNFDIAQDLDTAILYLYQGSLQSIQDDTKDIPEGTVILLDATDNAVRSLAMQAQSSGGAQCMLFAGKTPTAYCLERANCHDHLR